MRQCVLSVAMAVALVGIASQALAGDDFFGRTVGSFTFTDAEPPVLAGTIEQFFIVFEGPVAFDFLLMTFEITQQDTGPDTLLGQFSFLGADPADTLSGTFNGVNFPNDDGVWTGAGNWEANLGTGAFSGLSGSGSFTTALFIDDGSAATAFEGVIVPAPGVALIIAGVLPLAARRRRASFAPMLR